MPDDRRSGDRVYLDHNASAPLRPEAAQAMADAALLRGNPSSVHAEGRALRGLIERARADVAALVGCDAGDIVFTSGATEANAQALRSAAGQVIASGIEHPSVLENSIDRKVLNTHSDGMVSLEHLGKLLAAPAPAGARHRVAIMAANNETGVLQPIAAAAALCRAAGAHLHVDAVQAAGRIALPDLWRLADTMSLSAHKIGGAAGVGALIIRGGTDVPALIGGGGQEMRRRAGTENGAGIAAFGAAARAALSEVDGWADVRARRDRLEAEMKRLQPAVKIFGDEADRLPNTTCAGVAGVPADLLLMRLDLAGIAVSAGSACSSGKVSASPVLLAMGAGEAEARCAIRISQGHDTRDDETDRFLRVWSETVC